MSDKQIDINFSTTQLLVRVYIVILLFEHHGREYGTNYVFVHTYYR